MRKTFFVVLTPLHATQIPECKPIEGNIIDFMTGVGGGAVLVILSAPNPPTVGQPRKRKTKFEIQRLANGYDIAERMGRPVPVNRRLKPDVGLDQVGGTIP